MDQSENVRAPPLAAIVPSLQQAGRRGGTIESGRRWAATSGGRRATRGGPAQVVSVRTDLMVFREMSWREKEKVSRVRTPAAVSRERPFNRCASSALPARYPVRPREHIYERDLGWHCIHSLLSALWYSVLKSSMAQTRRDPCLDYATRRLTSPRQQLPTGARLGSPAPSSPLQSLLRNEHHQSKGFV